MYDFTKASDLVKWVQVQYNNKNKYKNGGIGRYDVDGTRQFDCCGLFKCFMWKDYSTSNAKYYGKTQKDLNCEGLFAEAKEKGTIDTIPEIPGVLVYQKGHMGIYIGKGMVIESTAKKYDGVHGKIYKTYFKGVKEHCDGKRTTWTHWFKSPYLDYENSSNKPIDNLMNSFFEGKKCFQRNDTHKNIGKIALFMRKTFPGYTNQQALGNYYGPYLEKAIKEFQRRAKKEGNYNSTIDGKIGPLTLKSLQKYGFKIEE